MWIKLLTAITAAGGVIPTGLIAADVNAVDPRRPSVAMIAGFERIYRSENTATALGGELLINELGCVACHRPSSKPGRNPAAKARQAPVLTDIGERVRLGYLQAFLTAPQEVKPGTGMPDLLGGLSPSERKSRAEALAHFLASQGGPLTADTNTPPTTETRSQGMRLYHNIGCVACHAPLETAESSRAQHASNLDELDGVQSRNLKGPTVPLGDQAAKTTSGKLSEFLLHPLRVRPSGRMPNMNLTKDEARKIAAYLMNRHPNSATVAVPANERQAGHQRIDPDKVARGRALFVSMGCASCHELLQDGERIGNRLDALPLEDLNSQSGRGCLAPTPNQGLPRYALDSAQKSAIRNAIERLQSHTEPKSLREGVDYTLATFDCYACHERDGVGGPGPQRTLYFRATDEGDWGEEGSIPPPLTGVGAKLKPDWLKKVLQGEGNVRPFMATRMPKFGFENLKHLTVDLAVVDEDPSAPSIDVSGSLHHHRNRYGRQLMGTEGLSCISCHNLKGRPSLGIPGIDLALAPQRLRPSWFKKFLLDPASIRPQTRMPEFFEDGKSTLKSVFGGDANKQIEAIWVYLREVDQTRLPPGMEETDRYELKPQDHAMVLRTFMKDVGTHAIAFGFPEEIHAAFDALTVRFDLAWRGKFLDAESTWADRFSPFTEPLSEDRWRFPPGNPFALLATASSPWPESTGRRAGYRMGGFRLRENGAPAFFYRFHGIRIEDIVEPADKEGWFRRVLTLNGSNDSLWYRAAVGREIHERQSNHFEIDGKWQLHFESPQESRAVIVETKDGRELRLPLRLENGTAIIKESWTWSE